MTAKTTRPRSALPPERVCETCGEAYRFRGVHEQSSAHLGAKGLLERLPGVSIVRDDLDRPHVVIEDDDGEP